ncbi:pimeloyl-ACP methyl ester carboxylesterase [Crossiella equi]|uniref:Pimeloyl-ACP methyl ester carboxylesterase n=1 Tax=Crossiella equi TaxID=130796 RepID=A0ABS5ARN6_9PSEU|nr:alpha/beta fold hydrolase [Crossiella equi]MBP2479234.1 pimeloyl-ACP methyl ester carboxylesterase [Crossiella equi]
MATFLLVHGAWHSGRAWDRVVPLLESAGHRVFAPSLTGFGDRAHLLGPEVGLGTHVDDVVDLVKAEGLEDVVLVGHSYAGMVISGVSDRIPERLAHLVFLDAMVPGDGEAAADVQPISAQLVAQAVDGWRVPPPPAPLGTFGVTDPEDAAWLRTLLSDQPARTLREPVRLANPAAHALPRTHIHCTRDQPKGIARRPVPAGQRVRELPTGHDCMITMPAELTALLLETV